MPAVPVPGVPDNCPVLVLKLAQGGLFTIEKLRALPSGSLAVGVKE